MLYVIMPSVKKNSDDNKRVNEDPKLRKFGINNKSNTNSIEHKSLEKDATSGNSTDTFSEYNELFDESYEEENSYEDFIKHFLLSKENVLAFIAAYRKRPHLWNFKHPVQCRKIQERVAIWQEIAKELHNLKNIQILTDQVAAVIMYMRQKYREKKVNAKNSQTLSNEIMPSWMFKQLSFLKPFVESESIAILDAHQDLSPQQTVQLLGILKRCTHLWDVNTIEYYCTNKRNAAIIQMQSIISEEIGLDVDVNTLRMYLQNLQNYFIYQKRCHMGHIKEAKTNSKFYRHMTFLYDHMGPFQCSHCQQTLFSPLQFKVHKSEHDGTMPLNCYVCNKDFKVVETYINHIRRHMNDFNRECKECGKKFMKLSELISHLRFHTGDKPYCCDVCGGSFRHRTSFNLHKKRHDKKYITFCQHCSKGFYTKGSLDVHLKSHKNDRDFVCHTCGKAFKTKTNLKAHLSRHENGRHECVKCRKTFTNRINLLQHKKRSHGSITD